MIPFILRNVNVRLFRRYCSVLSDEGVQFETARVFNSIAVFNNNTEFIVDDVKWSISKNKTGISIDEKTGLLTVAPNAKPGPVLIKAENLKYSTKSFFFLIDIER